MIQMPVSGEVYAAYAVTALPCLCSPCLQCVRKDKEKIKNVICQNCKAKSDLAAAYAGDQEAFERYSLFNYPNLGKSTATNTREKLFKNRYNMTTEDYYYDRYYEKCSEIIQDLYGVKFRTFKEIFQFMDQKFPVKTEIMRTLGFTRGVFDHMVKKFRI